MAAPHYVQRLRIDGYGCIKELELKLSPLHAFVGPNDSGKSTILRAIRTPMQLARSHFSFSGPVVAPFDPMLDPQRETRIAVSYADGLTYEIGCSKGGFFERALRGKAKLHENVARSLGERGMLAGSGDLTALASRLVPATLLRLDPNALKAPTPLLDRAEPIRFTDDIGTGLTSILQALNTRDIDAFIELRDQLRAFFPTLRTLRTPSERVRNGDFAVLEVDLATGEERIPASLVSEGLLYFLAFSMLRHLAPTSVLLVEEPENGLHPARVREVVKALREISTTKAQVLIATHSPLVINELAGDEVSVITRTAERGTEARLLKDTFNYAERRRIMQNGEIWLSYGDPEREADLLHGPSRARLSSSSSPVKAGRSSAGGSTSRRSATRKGAASS
jgi:ABC-type uncharacterized transport system ATPase subunit